MFTGIVTDIGEIVALMPTAQGRLHRLRVACRYDRATIADGASIAWLHAHGEVLDSRDDEGRVAMDVRLAEAEWERFKAR